MSDHMEEYRAEMTEQGKKNCLEYEKDTGLCKFSKGNCGNRGIRRKCNCNGFPARSMRDESQAVYNFKNDKLGY